jgi:hypothetical protein
MKIGINARSNVFGALVFAVLMFAAWAGGVDLHQRSEALGFAIVVAFATSLAMKFVYFVFCQATEEEAG